MSTNKKSQRIKLQEDGSPVKWDAEIIAYNKSDKSIKVRFEAEFMPDLDLWPMGSNGNLMATANREHRKQVVTPDYSIWHVS